MGFVRAGGRVRKREGCYREGETVHVCLVGCCAVGWVGGGVRSGGREGIFVAGEVWRGIGGRIVVELFLDLRGSEESVGY